MSSRRPLVVAVAGLAVPCGLVIALAGCFQLGVAGLVLATLVVGVVAAGAAAVPGENSAAVRRAGWAASWTAGLVLLVAGVEAIAGGVVAAVVAGLTGAALAGWWALRALGRWSAPLSGRRGTPGVGRPRSAAVPDPQVQATLSDMEAPVHRVPTSELGREWVRTSAALARPLDPETQQSVIRRRSEALDELQRRDPAGFSRWLSDESCPRSDPAAFVRNPSPPED